MPSNLAIDALEPKTGTALTEVPQEQDMPTPGPHFEDIDTPHGDTTASAVGGNQQSLSHGVDIEPTATLSSLVDHDSFEPASSNSATNNNMGSGDQTPKAGGVPNGVEIIDVDELPDYPDTWSTIKQESEIKAEPGTEDQSWAPVPFMIWCNTSEDPIVIDGEDEMTQIQEPTGQARLGTNEDILPETSPEQSRLQSMAEHTPVDKSMTLDRPGPPEAEHSRSHEDNPNTLHQAQPQIFSSSRVNFESGSERMFGKHNAHIPKGGIAGAGFQERLRGAQQTFFKSLRSPPKAADVAQLPDPPAINSIDEFDTDGMDIEFSDDEAKASWEGFKDAEQEFKNKKEAGNLTLADEIGFERLKKEEMMRMKKRKEDRRYEKEQTSMPSNDSIFVPMSNEEHISRGHLPLDSHDGEWDAIFGDLDDSGEVLSGDEQAEAMAPNGYQTARTSENQSIDICWEETLTNKKNKKGSKPNGRKQHAISTEKRKSKIANNPATLHAPKVIKRGRKPKNQSKPKPPKYAGPSNADVGSLLTGDLIQDAQANRGLPSLPTMTSTRRGKALAQLIASLPLEVQDIAKVDRRAFISASKDFRNGTIKIAEEGSRINGLHCTLRPHQVLGAAWMRRRERGLDQPKGGLVADQMGLGKTIQMLANIIDGRPLKDHKGPRTTLIVATPALANQWFEEINRHCDPRYIGRVIKHYGKYKLATNDTVATMQSFDVVITTYSEVMRSYPKADPPLDLQTDEEKKAWWDAYYEDNRGLLHQVHFHRVVVDEAQQVKHYQTWTSIAVRCLNANHRWLLSGTPVQNSLQELYAYFKFLRVPHTGSFKLFCKNFLGDKRLTQIGVDRLHAILNQIMLRRTHVDQLFGRPILKLPDARYDIFWVRFNELERAVYETVRSRMIKRINKLSLAGEAEANYSNILTMLLRLRQLTGHILMVETTLKDLLEREDVEKLAELANQEAVHGMEPVRREQIVELRKMLAFHLQSRKHPRSDSGSEIRTSDDGSAEIPQTEEEVEKMYTESYSDEIGHDYGTLLNFRKYLQELRTNRKWDEIANRTICVFCNDKAQDPWIASCLHIYCAACLNMLLTSAAEEGKDKARCSECGVEFHGSHPCDDFDIDPVDEEDFPLDSESEQRVRKRKGKKRNGKRENEGVWIDLRQGGMLPSSKTVAVKAQILNWLEENPKAKIIVYTQFLDMIRIMARICCAERWAHQLYHGGMSHDARAASIKNFEEKAEVHILLASLKCGGVGLNLTMAQKVISIDPWWNSAVEQQAFGRVFRIGQKFETAITRFVVENTVDQRIIEMQERKRQQIGRVMDGTRRKLTTHEMLSLFGDTDEDGNGNHFIMVEDRETFPNPADENDEDHPADET